MTEKRRILPLTEYRATVGVFEPTYSSTKVCLSYAAPALTVTDLFDQQPTQ